MSEPTYFDGWNYTGRVATQCHESEKPEYSRLLGPDGKPLKYEKPPIGFDLKRKPE